MSQENVEILRRWHDAWNRGDLDTVTVSLGIAHDPDCDFTDVLHRADAALYEAKTLGRNRSVVYGDLEHGARSQTRSGVRSVT